MRLSAYTPSGTIKQTKWLFHTLILLVLNSNVLSLITGAGMKFEHFAKLRFFEHFRKFLHYPND